jgi:hypothetical protein
MGFSSLLYQGFGFIKMNEKEFWAALHPIETKPVFYRLYHDEQGFPLFFSQEDLPGKYITLDQATYNTPHTHIKVIDGKLVTLDTSVIAKLTPTTYGVSCHPLDVSIVVDTALPHIKWNIV